MLLWLPTPPNPSGGMENNWIMYLPLLLEPFCSLIVSNVYHSSLQMLMVLEALVPCYLQKLKSNTLTMESASAARDEIAAIAALATSLQALLYSSESLTRSRSCQYSHNRRKP